METWAFKPLYSRGAALGNGTFEPSTTIAASSTAATNTAPFAGTTTNNAVTQIQIANQTSSWAYVNFGYVGSVTAATAASSYPVAPGGVVVVTVPGEVSAASVILDGAATGNVIFTRGSGL